MEATDYLDFDEAVVFLKTTPSTLYKWLQAGKIPGHKLGRQWRFLKDELELHVSGQASKITLNKEANELFALLEKRNQQKEQKMDMNTDVIPEKIIWDAYDHGSRVVHIYPTKGQYEIAYRTRAGLDKLSTIQEEFFRNIDENLIKFSSEASTVGARRLNLQRDTGSASADVLQVNYQKVETIAGPRITLRIWQPEKDVMPLEKITSQADVLEKFKQLANKRQGLIIVSGASGSGKTTTMYSLISEFRKKGNVIFSIEDNTQVVIEGIQQVEFKSQSETKLEEIFQSVYSSDPDVICLGLGSAFGLEDSIYNLAYKAAATGHLVLLQMSQATCAEALQVFKSFVKYPVENVVVGVTSQKLVAESGKIKAVYDFMNEIG